jgi:hypothetical protein
MRCFALALFACVTTLALGQTAQTAPKKPIVPTTQATPATGRYQIVMNPNARADTFLLDTQTGMVWHRVPITDVENNPSIWMPEDRVDSEQEFLEWGAKQVPKKK